MTAVVGVGTAARGDDAVGLVVADRLRELGVPVVPVVQPMDLLEVFDAHDEVVVVDAVRTGADPGTVIVTAVEAALPARAGPSGTHGFGVAEVVELARALGRLPERLVLVGVEGARFGRGDQMSEQVSAATEQAVAAVLSAVR